MMVPPPPHPAAGRPPQASRLGFGLFVVAITSVAPVLVSNGWSALGRDLYLSPIVNLAFVLGLAAAILSARRRLIPGEALFYLIYIAFVIVLFATSVAGTSRPPGFVAKDAAVLLVPLGLMYVFQAFASVPQDIERPLAWAALAEASAVAALALALGHHRLNIDQSLVCVGLILLGRTKPLLSILALWVAAVALPQEGSFKIVAALTTLMYALWPLVQAVVRYLTPGSLALMSFSLLAVISATMGIDGTIDIANSITNAKSVEARLFEFQMMMNRPAPEIAFGSGLGYSFDLNYFRAHLGIADLAFADWSEGGRARVFHYSATWAFAKLGVVGVILLFAFYFIAARAVFTFMASARPINFCRAAAIVAALVNMSLIFANGSADPGFGYALLLISLSLDPRRAKARGTFVTDGAQASPSPRAAGGTA